MPKGIVPVCLFHFPTAILSFQFMPGQNSLQVPITEGTQAVSKFIIVFLLHKHWRQRVGKTPRRLYQIQDLITLSHPSSPSGESTFFSSSPHFSCKLLNNVVVEATSRSSFHLTSKYWPPPAFKFGQACWGDLLMDLPSFGTYPNPSSQEFCLDQN